MKRPIPADQQADDDELRHGHNNGRKSCGIRNTELDGKGHEAHLAIAFDGFEIIERHDAMRTNAIEQGQGDNRVRGHAMHHDGGARKPRQPFVANGNRAIAKPAIFLETERRHTIGPRCSHPEKGGEKNRRSDFSRNQ